MIAAGKLVLLKEAKANKEVVLASLNQKLDYLKKKLEDSLVKKEDYSKKETSKKEILETFKQELTSNQPMNYDLLIEQILNLEEDFERFKKRQDDLEAYITNKVCDIDGYRNVIQHITNEINEIDSTISELESHTYLSDEEIDVVT